MPRRLYSEAEARAILPEIIPVLQRLRDCFVALRALQAQVQTESRGASGDGHLLADPWAANEGENRAEALTHDLQAAAARLEQLGIELKDPEKGLIDFYHERDGAVVYLCYMLGEPDIQFWHDLQSGFAGRQPL